MLHSEHSEKKKILGLILLKAKKKVGKNFTSLADKKGNRKNLQIIHLTSKGSAIVVWLYN